MSASATLPSATLAPTPTEAANSLSFQGLNRLSAMAQANPRDPQTIKAATRQFEALLVQRMLETMNATSLGPDLLGDNAGAMYKSMMNQQLAATVTQGQGIGLSNFLARELSARYGGHTGAKPPLSTAISPLRHAAGAPAPAGAAVAARAPFSPADGPATDAAAATTAVKAATSAASASGAAGDARTDPAPVAAAAGDAAAPRPRQAAGGSLADRAQSFVQAILPSVKSAASALGVSPVAILAQAALETGWGSHAAANNLFGVKAGGAWNGASLQALTHEVANGVSSATHAAFRAYRDAADSVHDYARLLTDSPRYAAVRGHGDDIAAFAGALQRSGYATDPQYASKLVAVAHSPVMREALAALGVQAPSSSSRP